MFKTSECCDIFCGVIDEQRAIKQHIESNKLRIEVLKENNNDKEYVFSNHLYTEEWEMQLAKAVENNSCVTVIFKIDDKLAEIEMPSHNVIERLISTPHEWGYFETYDFVLEGGGCKSGIREQKIIDKLGRKPNCEDIVEIRANGKVTYRK